LIIFDKKNIFLIIFVFLFFLIPTLLHLHGFSIAPWRTFTDGSGPEETIYGQSQSIRSDDFIYYLPLAISQVHHKPPYPIINTLIGQGQNSLIMSVPAFHWVTLFRPQVWGYFYSAETGISWDWWFRVVGLFYSSFLVFMMISKNRFWVSFFSSIALLYAPFFQFWSLNLASLTVFANISLLSAVSLFFSNSKKNLFLNSIVLAWALSSFLFVIYPPAQIALIYLYSAILIGFVFNEWKNEKKILNLTQKAWAFSLAIFFVFIWVTLFIIENQTIFETMRNTEYPGKRSVLGGDFAFWRLLSNSFIPWESITNWGLFGNICEAASFIFFFPLIVGALIIEFFKKRRITNYLNLSLILFFTLAMIWGFFGLPDYLSKWSLLSNVPPNRFLIGMGVANLILIVSFLGQPDVKETKPSVWYYLLSPIWFALCFYSGFHLREVLPEISLLRITIFSFGLTFIGILILQKKTISIVFIAILSIMSSYWFNPLVKGGVEFLNSNTLSKKILDLDKELGGDSVWLTYDDNQISNLLKTIGIKSVNGIHVYPQLEVWKKLDPKGKYIKEYNRYAHVVFHRPPNRDIIYFSSPQSDILEVFIHPGNPKFKELGVDYIILVNREKSSLDAVEKIKWEFSFKNKHIYRVLR